MKVQWYPGHMTRARRDLERLVPLADAVLEVVDARIPRTSRNPDLAGVLGDRPRVVLLGKADLAESTVTAAWRRYLGKREAGVIDCDLRGSGWPIRVRKLLIQAAAGRRKGGRPVRVVTVGIPNAGKSTAINRLAGGARTRVGALPGVTRGPQWIRADDQLMLLDSPGLLWPRLDGPDAGLHLAVTGAIRDQVYDVHEAAVALLEVLWEKTPFSLAAQYGPYAGGDGLGWLQVAGRRRGLLVAGGLVDERRAAQMVLKDFRSGKLGRVSLELPPDNG